MKNSDAPSAVADVMNEVGVWWAVAGGWAIDLWLGEQTREHHDVEIIVRRCDQAVVHASLARRCALYCLDPPGSGWRPWNGVPIEPPAFQLEARSSTYEFDIFTETTDQEVWFFRRDARITRLVSAMATQSAAGIPIVRPEVQLLYMAKAMEAKNAGDFETARRHLGDDQAHWLADALSVTLPDHPWIKALR